MAVLYITEHPYPVVYQGLSAMAVSLPPLAEQTVAIGGTSAQSAAFNAKTRIIGVHTDAICSISVDEDPTATTDNRRMAAGATEYFEVQPGHKIAVIENT